MITLAQETGKIQPMGYVLIVGFAIILIWGLIHDRKKAGQFKGEIDKMFQDKIAGTCGNYIITTDNRLVEKFDLGIGSGYSMFSLADVAYIMTYRDSTVKTWKLALYDSNKKRIKGQKFDSRKKKASKTGADFITKGEDIELRDFIHSYVPQAKLVGLGFKEI